jgi:hypothetical protein
VQRDRPLGAAKLALPITVRVRPARRLLHAWSMSC